MVTHNLVQLALAWGAWLEQHPWAWLLLMLGGVLGGIVVYTARTLWWGGWRR